MIWALVIAALAAVAVGSRWFADYVCGGALFGGLIAAVNLEWGNLLTCILVFMATLFLVYRQEIP